MKEKLVKGLKWFFFSYIWLVPVFLAIDIVTKLVIFNAAQGIEGTTVAEIIPHFLRIQYVANDSAAFGFGFGSPLARRIVYICIASLGSIGLSVYYGFKYNKISSFVKACLMLVVCGALGNLIDRLFYSFSDYRVIDWIDFYGIWGFHFNIADSCIVVGAIMLIVYLIVEEVKEYKARKAREPKEEKPVGKVLSVEEQRRLDEIEAEKSKQNEENSSN